MGENVSIVISHFGSIISNVDLDVQFRNCLRKNLQIQIIRNNYIEKLIITETSV